MFVESLATNMGNAVERFAFNDLRTTESEVCIGQLGLEDINLHHPDHFELSLLRHGLVPPGFTSPKEADRYGLHTVRAKRITWQRDVIPIPVNSLRN